MDGSVVDCGRHRRALLANADVSHLPHPLGWRTVLLAAAAGALTMLILAPVVGVPRLTACIAGVAAGALSGFLTWRCAYCG